MISTIVVVLTYIFQTITAFFNVSFFKHTFFFMKMLTPITFEIQMTI